MEKMNNKKTCKIDVRVDEDTMSKFNELIQYHNISKTKLVEKMISHIYDKDILMNEFAPNAKKKCMTHMCNIVNFANCVENNELRKNILEEVTKACQILR